ncbi:hypothetical protein [Cypionkella sp.]|uniref:hypothetical protein n=1 Tax=Cypionkella sp. TaxID=2811411 RepID=UPI0027258326|nr:hypothetical protein [Cypionkella sp.]MDO8986448.1 hypothetical protein [Cypionkella sp.]MDP1578165.1 hypothetical protein [Cypionkella sp.]MDP2048211.1 hypothetical protein [Cypionkella sp.]
MIKLPSVKAALLRDIGMATAKPHLPPGMHAGRFPGAFSTHDSQTLGGLRNPLPSKEGKVGFAEKSKHTL